MLLQAMCTLSALTRDQARMAVGEVHEDMQKDLMGKYSADLMAALKAPFSRHHQSYHARDVGRPYACSVASCSWHVLSYRQGTKDHLL